MVLLHIYCLDMDNENTTRYSFSFITHKQGNHLSLDFCTLITTLSLHHPTSHLKWSWHHLRWESCFLFLPSLSLLLHLHICLPVLSYLHAKSSFQKTMLHKHSSDITFFWCSRQLQPLPSTSQKEGILTLPLAPFSATTTTLIYSQPLQFQKSILPFWPLTTLNKVKLRKQHINESWKRGTYLSANVTCLTRVPISLQ